MKDLEQLIGDNGQEITTMEEVLAPKVEVEEVEVPKKPSVVIPETPVETMEDYAAELEASFWKIRVGDVLTGKVIDADETGVLIDFDYYAPGKISAEDMSADPSFNILTDVAVGDILSATVVRLDDGAGNLVLSRKQADQVLAWDKLKDMMENKTVIKGTIKEVVKAGAILYVEGIRGFIPASKLALEYVEDTTPFLNQEVEVQIVTVEEENEKLVLSAKELLNIKAMEEKKEKANALEEGTVLEGTVEQLKDYGAFVGLGDGISGLLHISQISDKKIKHPKVVLSVGQKVRVKITKIQDGKISLSMKELNDVTSKEITDEPVEYTESGSATTGLGALLAGFKFD